MIIDLHAHLAEPDGYLDDLLREMDRLGIDKVCLSAFGPHMRRRRGNEDVAAAMGAHPDRVVGFVFVRLGVDGPEKVRQWHDQGMTGVKVIYPMANYDDPAYYPIWAQAQELGMPVLFHTGFVGGVGGAAMPEEDVSSVRMQPMFLEPIARAFPDLKLICAHLGVHWNEDAAELLRMRPNVYADLTGEPDGYRVRVLPKLADYLWWPGAFDKLVFGSDVSPEKIETNLTRDRQTLASLDLPQGTVDRYFHGNARELLGL